MATTDAVGAQYKEFAQRMGYRLVLMLICGAMVKGSDVPLSAAPRIIPKLESDFNFDSLLTNRVLSVI